MNFKILLLPMGLLIVGLPIGGNHTKALNSNGVNSNIPSIIMYFYGTASINLSALPGSSTLMYNLPADGTVNCPVPKMQPENMGLIQKLKDLILGNSINSWNAYGSGGQNKVLEYLSQHKFLMSIQILLAGYFYINYILFSYGRFLLMPNRWIYWKHELTLSKLMQVPQEELINEMLASLSLRAKGRNLLLTEKLEQLIRELKQDLSIINRYKSISNIIITCDDLQHRLCNICDEFPNIIGLSIGCVARYAIKVLSAKNMFYIDEKLYKSTQEFQDRILYLKNSVEAFTNQLEESA